jgi:hypothetical protein
MSMPISESRPKLRLAAAIACLALAACGGGKDGGNASGSAAALPGEATQGDDGRAECAIGQGASWARTCLVERSDGPEGKIVTLRHPDGGFRRLRIVTDGRGLVPADGAEDAKLSITGDHQIEVAVAQDRYRLPATIGAPKP